MLRSRFCDVASEVLRINKPGADWMGWVRQGGEGFAKIQRGRLWLTLDLLRMDRGKSGVSV
jgi:crotonobetainyl-CoA:carnitine CoA-transferase CaiB-like acyl-CoA transferase